MANLIDTAQTAARNAGKILLQHYGKVDKSDIRKKSATDFLSFVDEKAEQSIIETIKNDFNDHAILAEESGADQVQNDYRWIIDPLGGTKNYLNNIPVFAISIGVEYKQEMVAAIVYDPVHDELFSAERGSGAFLNGTRIHVSEKSTLAESFIATGFPFKNKHLLQDYLLVFQNIFDQCVGARRLGAAAIDLAYIACGKFEGFWEIGLNPWDMAAGALLIKEAGGKISDFWDKPYYMNNAYVLATNGHIHNALGEIIREAFPFYKVISEGA